MEETLNEMFHKRAELYSKRPAVKVKVKKRFEAISYHELWNLVKEFGTGLIHLGIRSGDHIGMISDNRLEWLICDLAILGIGAVDVPRGSDITLEEVKYILNHSDSRGVIVEDEEQLKKVLHIKENLPHLEKIIVMDENYKGKGLRNVYPFDEVLKRGRELLKRGDQTFLERSKTVKPQDLATIIYTSGTTGEPKGVMLSHANIMHNVRVLPPLFNITYEDRFLSILPPWHAFERTVEYVALSCGASIAYSKPARQVLLANLQLEKPTLLACVPRVYEGMYQAIWANIRKEKKIKQRLIALLTRMAISYIKGVRILKGTEPIFRREVSGTRYFKRLKALSKKLLFSYPYFTADKLVFSKIREITGGCLRLSVSGGGALPHYLDDFFEAAGIRILEGYGLTETSPVVCCRLLGREIAHTVGPPVPETEIKIADERGNPLPPGQQGRIMIRGPQVMMGYYKDEDATKMVMDEEGRFDSGDLGRLTQTGELQITGRAKDTIVLRSGENVEPEPIECKLRESPFIKQVMIIGQDKRQLGALIVPDFDEVKSYLDEEGIKLMVPAEIIEEKKVVELFRKEVNRLVAENSNFKKFEKISKFELIPEEFKVGEELTHTLKMKRDLIAAKYEKEIERMFKKT